MAFFELRQDGWPPASVQALFSKTEGVVSKQMIKFATALPTETLVYVEGTVEEAKTPIRSTTVQDVEIKVTKVCSLGLVVPVVKRAMHVQCFVAVPVTAERLPFTRNGRFEEQPPTDPPIPAVTLNTRLENRVFDFRVPVTQAIFRLSSAVEDLFRSYLKSQGFLSIHSPKLQGAATESGASVFTVEYFSRAFAPWQSAPPNG